jgi:transposase
MKQYYVGMDVHQASIVIVVLNALGKVVIESIIETKAQTVRDFIRGLRGEVHVTFEEGTQAAWLYDLIRPHVAEIIVCNPRHNKLLAVGNKGDRIDARKLAQLLRAGMLKAVYHGEHGTRALKEMVRTYESLVADTTRVMNRLKALFRGRGIRCSGHEVYRSDRRDEWLKKLVERGRRARAESLYRQLVALTELRSEARQAMLAESRRHQAHKLLMRVPKLGPVRVAQIIATVDTPHRFRTKRQFWSYLGLAVVMRTSAEYRVVGHEVQHRKRAPATRGLNGGYNHRLKGVFKAAATSACAAEPFKQQYDSLVAKGISPEMARLTVTRKLAAITLAVWKRGQRFDAERVLKQAA